jgi:carbamoyl-phosphate synthase small subunit
LRLKPDGILLANGPGDPAVCHYAISAIQDLLKTDIPIFGICLGFQLLALATGGKTRKMKFGHHGANHPVLDIVKNRVMITSQNHGFCVVEDSLPNCWKITHRSLFDGTLQGFIHTAKPVLGFQGHPEASPGPHDVTGLFDQFISWVQERK